MKKNLLIIRFGVTYPLNKEIELILNEISAPEDQDLATGRPLFDIGIVSVVRTRLTQAEVVMKYEALAAELDDMLPIIVLDLDSRDSRLSLEDEGFRKMINDFQAGLAARDPDCSAKKPIEMSLDELLDLANSKGGVDMLSAEELQVLKKLSEN